VPARSSSQEVALGSTGSGRSAQATRTCGRSCRHLGQASGWCRMSTGSAACRRRRTVPSTVARSGGGRVRRTAAWHQPVHLDAVAVATRLNNLAAVLGDLGEPAAARLLLDRALAITEAAHGPEHPAVATSLNNLAAVLRDLGEPAAARLLLDRALTIHEAAHGPEHPAVATSLGNLAAGCSG